MTKLYFFTESRFYKYNKNFYNPSGVLKYNLFKRYLDVFDELVVVARVMEVTNEEHCIDSNRVDGDSITVIELPYYHGVYGYILKRRQVYNKLKSVVDLLKNEDKCLLRVPGNIGELVSKILYKRSIPYYLEVVGDPMDVFSKGANNHPLRYVFKILLTSSLKKTVFKANGVCYITSLVLPERYPANNFAFTNIVSNVKLVENDYIESVRPVDLSSSINLISIGSLEQMYKGPDVVLNAIKMLLNKKIDVNLLWLGDGIYKKDMIALSKELGLEQNCRFIGYVHDKHKINMFLDNSDLFILASKAEAQGRVIIEAMARGKIVVATNVGGIPENVPNQFLIPKDDYEALANKIIELKAQNDLSYWQKLNLKRAKDYNEETLQIKRILFLKKILND